MQLYFRSSFVGVVGYKVKNIQIFSLYLAITLYFLPNQGKKNEKPMIFKGISSNNHNLSEGRLVDNRNWFIYYIK